MEYKDYYKILGVSRDAPADEIKRAYRRLARKYHPDVSKEADAEARFKEVAEAYEALKDPEKRRAYDQLGSGWHAGEDFRPPPDWEFHGGGFEEGDFSDFFESLFGGGGFGRQSPFDSVFGAGGARRGGGFTARGGDQSARIDVSLEEAYSGSERTVALETAEPDAQGHLRRSTQNLRVRIPPGIKHGQRIRLQGQGGQGLGGGQRGDLLLEVHIRPHRLFHLHERNVHVDLPVAPWEAALGARIKVPTLGGEVDMTIPAGSQSGKRLRLRGRGLPGDPPGDQIVTLKIVNPPADDEKARKHFEAMARECRFDPRAGLTRS
ncbi:MAG: DnaJ C-terminal domain-containing protein [Ectothiorhodospiraceae bacterium]|jgi:curved DNA-binding protein